jgi:hypothetical protein
MSKLAKLLGAKEPLFTLAVRDLEKVTGRKSLDVLLLTEIEQKIGNRTRRLGLDPSDTTGSELFTALGNRVEADNVRVTQLIGGTDHSDAEHIVPFIVEAAKAAKMPRSCWVLKRSVAKGFLRKMPPRSMMKHLGYRSIDSMLKHENFDEIYSALRFSEGPEWLNAYDELFKTIKPSDFEIRDINILVLDHDKWADLSAGFTRKKLHNVTHTKELGTIVVLPMHVRKMRGLTLKTLPLILHYINEIRLYSAFFKLKSTRKTFGTDVVDTLIGDPSNAALMAGQHIHWRVIQKYLGRHRTDNPPEILEPHVQPEDLHWRKAEEMLCEIDPEMEFWKDLDYVGRIEDDGYPQAFSLLDASFQYSNEEKYADRYFYHFRESLWNELFMRYMGEKVLEEQVLRQLDNDLIAPEKLVSKK